MFWLLASSFVFFFPAQSVHAVITFTNPLKNPNGPDPFIIHDSGFHYHTTTWKNLQITRATTTAGLKTAIPITVYSSTASSRCCNMWTPVIHEIGGMLVMPVFSCAFEICDLIYTHSSVRTFILLLGKHRSRRPACSCSTRSRQYYLILKDITDSIYIPLRDLLIMRPIIRGRS